MMSKTFPTGKIKAAVSLAVLAGMAPFNVPLVMAPFIRRYCCLCEVWYTPVFQCDPHCYHIGRK